MFPAKSIRTLFKPLTLIKLFGYQVLPLGKETVPPVLQSLKALMIAIESSALLFPTTQVLAAALVAKSSVAIKERPEENI